MSFDARNGTHGARAPGPKALMRFVNRFTVKKVRNKGGRFMGMDVLVLTTVGRRSGESRTAPVGYFPASPDSWLIVASAAGSANNPAWYSNIAAHPDQVKIELPGRSADVVAEQLHGEERAAAWQQIITAAPRFAQYEAKTDRAIPVIRLTARP